MEASDGFSDDCLKNENGSADRVVIGQYFRGLAFYKGLCGPVNYKEAAEWFTKAAEQEDDFNSDSEWISKKCKQSAWYYLGFMYYYGQGVSQNYQKAFKWLLLAAGEAYCLGGRFFIDDVDDEDDYEVEPDLQRYLDNHDNYFRIYSDGEQAALAIIGDAYRDGCGVKQDYSKAVACYKEAGGSDSACKSLGDMYRDGLGVEQDYSKAAEYYERAASRNADAMDSLADLYRNGQGVAKDPAEAMKWYMKAAQNGSSDAKKKIMEMMGGFADAGISPDAAQKEITG